MTDLEFQIENFIIYCTSKNLSKKTIASYEQALKLFAQFLQDEFEIIEVKKIQSGHIRHYIKHLQERGKYTVVVNQNTQKINNPHNRTDYNKKISDATIANYLRNIKVFFNYLKDVEGEITKNPCEKIEQIKAERKQKKTLTKDELKKLFNAFDESKSHEYRNKIITILLFDTGMRVGECLILKPEHIDFSSHSILITNPKSKKQRYVYFSHKMGRQLKSWLKHKDRQSDSQLLFPTNRGTQLQIQNYEKVLRQTGKKVNVDVHPHQLRNNFAKYYLLAGGDFATLSRILGHSDVSTTMKAYLDFTDDEVGRKYQKHSPLSSIDF
ncbi:integrase/recombinase XerD [Desulfitispora alkaliphila]|uniref:tyrosine-type recombinase/integrase n=1 Tax=Desulfitispora alkaliphila TaxID=622674 RepID=UPI003D1E39A3